MEGTVPRPGPSRSGGAFGAIERLVPGIRVIRGYRRAWLLPDLVAGFAVCILSIPISLACSGLIGVEPRQGLFTALVGLVAFSLFTSSRAVVAGPDTAVAILVAGAVGPWAGGDPARVASLAALVAMLAGALMLVMAAARLGAVADFLSRPVLIGFMNGAGLIVIVSQLGKLLGLKLESRDFLAVAREIAGRLDHVQWPTAAIGIGFIASIFVAKRFFPRLPGSLIVFVLSIAASFAFGLERRGFEVIGAIPQALPGPVLPAVRLSDITQLLPAAAGIAFLTFPEAILLARAFGDRHSSDVEPNRELFALGAANVLSGAVRGFSIAASSTRTPLSVAVGSRTQVAHLFAAGFLVAFLLFLTPLIERLPLVALAAILIYSGLMLIDFANVGALWRMSWKSAGIAILTTLVVLVVGVIPGILVGVLLSLILVIHQVSRPPDAVLRQVGGRKGMHDVADEGDGVLVPGLLAYRFYAPLIFSNVNWFVERVRDLVSAEDPPARWVLLDAQAISDLDVTAAERIAGLVSELRERGVTFAIANANRPLREKLERFHLTTAIGQDQVYKSVNNALKAFLSGAADEPVVASSPVDRPTESS